jgi:two-component system response regulator
MIAERRILLVEDNPDDEALMLRAFSRSRIQNPVHIVRDGQEALDHLHGTASTPPGPLPALVLLDLKLPRIDGLEVLRRIRATPRTALLPVVVLTSSDEEGDLVGSYTLGANSYVRKPVDFDAFVAATRQLGLYWLLLNVAPTAADRRPTGAC